MVSEDIPGFFEVYGWKYERREPTVYRTGFVGDFGSWDIWLRATESWVFFTINPYITRPGGDRHSTAVLRAVLQANNDLNLAKFAVDEDGDISLSVELPAEGFVYSHFSDALTALAHYADEYQGRLEAAQSEEGSVA